MLTISGVARVFVTKRSLLHSLGDFPKAWRLLQEHVEKLALSPTQEVRLPSINFKAGAGQLGIWTSTSVPRPVPQQV